MALPSTKPLDGEFWYVLDDENIINWKPCPKTRGDFYLGWLGQNRNVVGAGLVHIEQGQLTHICTHGTPYYWLQPYEVLSFTSETMRAQQVLGADTMTLDFSLAGWGLRDQTSPQPRLWSDAPIPAATLRPLLDQATAIIVHNFRSEGEPQPRSDSGGLLARVADTRPPDPLDELLDLLRERLGETHVAPVLTELVRHDINVMPSYRQSDYFESLSTEEKLPPPSKVARLVLSAIYHLAPLLGSQRLNNVLLLNSLRQRHPFDVTWGADLLVKCFGMPSLVRLLQVALLKEQSDQVRGNVLDLLQELGYGLNAGLGDKVLRGMTDLLKRTDLGAFGQVFDSHLTFIQEYLRQRDAAQSTG
jgi:hypothetical protein